MGVRFEVGSSTEVSTPPVERLLPHPALPLVAAFDAGTPLLHVVSVAGGDPQVVGTVGHGDRPYPEPGWERMVATPGAAWHPSEPLLVVGTADGTLLSWSPEGVERLEAASNPVPPWPVDLAVSPDGLVLWRTPSSHDDADDDAERTDVVDLRTGSAVAVDGAWDGGVVAHPGGRVLLSLQSDQGATLVVLGVAEDDPPRLVVRDRVLVLDADGYGLPMVSPDGGFVAVGGNSDEDLLQVVTFPDLEAVVTAPLGDVRPDVAAGAPAWLLPASVARTCFAPTGSTLLVATPHGSVATLSLPDLTTVEHDVVPGRRVSAMATGADGSLLVALAEGGLRRVPMSVDPSPLDAERARERVEALLEATRPVEPGVDLWSVAELRDGHGVWDAESLGAVEDASPTDPTWLQLQAAINRAERGSDVVEA